MTVYISTDPKAAWITPQEQYLRLNNHKKLAEQITKSQEILISVIANIVAEYLVNSKYTIWHDSLAALNALPEKMPPLPENIFQTLEQNCPLHHNKKKADGSAYKLGETHTAHKNLRKYMQIALFS